jgi:FtsP/CotA-like multicopper oxidase with cupredoxin domain
MDNIRPKAIVAAVAFALALVVSMWTIPRGSAITAAAAASSAQSQGSSVTMGGVSPSSGSGVGMGGSGTSSSSGSGTSTNWRTAMNQMKAWDDSFPAKTAGLGGQLLQPTQILPDGTKVFHLTTKIVKWETSPGTFVQAWTYNGVVPGPLIWLNVGDKVRIIVKNELPEPTTIHWHGLPVPNDMDGIPFVSQNPIVPGGTFTYAFTAKAPAVSWYHSHYDGTLQVTNGLYGAIFIGHMKVPAGVHVDQYYTMMLQDSGVIGLTINGKSFPATQEIKEPLNGWLEVNYIGAGTMAHPMHLHGVNQLVIAQDGSPVPQPYEVNTLSVSPGQTFTVLVHATLPGIWAWHCHIFPHAEGPQGMFGIFTELDIYKKKA